MDAMVVMGAIIDFVRENCVVVMPFKKIAVTEFIIEVILEAFIKYQIKSLSLILDQNLDLPFTHVLSFMVVHPFALDLDRHLHLPFIIPSIVIIHQEFSKDETLLEHLTLIF